MDLVTILAADIGAKALLLLYLWLASAIAASELAKRKNYPEKLGLGTGHAAARRRAAGLARRAAAPDRLTGAQDPGYRPSAARSAASTSVWRKSYPSSAARPGIMRTPVVTISDISP